MTRETLVVEQVEIRCDFCGEVAMKRVGPPQLGDESPVCVVCFRDICKRCNKGFEYTNPITGEYLESGGSFEFLRPECREVIDSYEEQRAAYQRMVYEGEVRLRAEIIAACKQRAGLED